MPTRLPPVINPRHIAIVTVEDVQDGHVSTHALVSQAYDTRSLPVELMQHIALCILWPIVEDMESTDEEDALVPYHELVNEGHTTGFHELLDYLGDRQIYIQVSRATNAPWFYDGEYATPL